MYRTVRVETFEELVELLEKIEVRIFERAPRVYDRKTHYVLWALTESITEAYLQKTHDNNFDQALTALTMDLKRLTSAPASTASNH